MKYNAGTETSLVLISPRGERIGSRLEAERPHHRSCSLDNCWLSANLITWNPWYCLYSVGRREAGHSHASQTQSTPDSHSWEVQLKPIFSSNLTIPHPELTVYSPRPFLSWSFKLRQKDTFLVPPSGLFRHSMFFPKQLAQSWQHAYVLMV